MSQSRWHENGDSSEDRRIGHYWVRLVGGESEPRFNRDRDALPSKWSVVEWDGSEWTVIGNDEGMESIEQLFWGLDRSKPYRIEIVECVPPPT